MDIAQGNPHTGEKVGQSGFNFLVVRLHFLKTYSF